MSKVCELADTNDTLFPVDDHPVVREEAEDLTEVRFMLLFSVAGDEDVIQVYKDEREATEDAVHQSLECLGSVLETKGHAEELPEPKGSDDGCLGDIFRHNRDLVVAAYQVHLGKDLLARQTAIEILYVGQWVPIVHCGIVEAPEVTARSPAATWFRNHVKWRCPGRVGTSDDAHPFHLGKFKFGNLQLLLFETMSTSVKRWTIGGDVVLHTMLIGVRGLEAGNEQLGKLVDNGVERVNTGNMETADGGKAGNTRCHHIEIVETNETLIRHVNRQPIGGKEISAENGFRDLCHVKFLGECVALAE